MRNFIILSEQKWHESLFIELSKRRDEIWTHIHKKSDFIIKNLQRLNPDLIFIPHWSYIIPEEIWGSYKCVIFHMTDLPYGRGGSPLQNLIVRGHSETVISAIKVVQGIDTGPIYLKAPLSLAGSAQEIFERSVPLIHKMIETIIDEQIEPKPQTGEPVIFKRRKPDQGNVSSLTDVSTVYDYIRMLDADGYPSAFMESDSMRFEFHNAHMNNDNEVVANVRIIKK